ncbi:hypothetical protein BH23CHL5_BH23CHL5_28440 [soil metagenome]
MIFAPYRNVLDFARDVNGSDARPQLAWDEIDYELGGEEVALLRSIARRAGRWIATNCRAVRRNAHNPPPSSAYALEKCGQPIQEPL